MFLPHFIFVLHKYCNFTGRKFALLFCFLKIIYTVHACAKGYVSGRARVWYVCAHCVGVCVYVWNRKMYIYTLTSQTSLRKRCIYRLLIHFICHQRCLLYLLSHTECTILLVSIHTIFLGGLQRIFWNVIEINCHAHCLAWWKPRKSQPQHDCSALKSQLTLSTAQSSLLTVFSAYRCVLRNSSYVHDWLALPTLLLMVIKFWCW